MLQLRIHALIVSVALLFLVGLLGTRAYSSARTHYREVRELADQDLTAQSALLRIEAGSAARDQTRRKFLITHDPAYAALADKQQDLIDAAASDLAGALASSYPDLEPRAWALKSGGDVRQLSDDLGERREAKLQHAHLAALALLRLIVLALSLSAITTAWLLYFFYRGLIQPLGALKEATGRIRDGELSHRMRTDQGVGDLRELAESFNSMAARLESLDRSKNEFLATVSHEIRNPLAALKEGLSLLVARGEELPAPARAKGFAACLIASKRLEAMINNLLNFSKIEGGLFDLNLTCRDLSAAIQTAIDEVRPIADKRGIGIRFDGPPELVTAFHWDGMVQVLENLILNAIKYGDENSAIEVEARSLARSDESRVPRIEISVTNQGQPVAQAEVSKLFERFYRGSNAHGRSGMGLGLHVVKRIVEAHHGSVSAECESERTRVRVWIPSLASVAIAFAFSFICLAACSTPAKKTTSRIPVVNEDSVAQLETRLATIRSSQVIIPTRTLRAILKNESVMRNQCKNLSVQLEAIKHVDLDPDGDGP